MRYRDLPPWAWKLITDLADYEKWHGKDWPCLGELLRAVPPEVRDAADLIEQVKTELKPASAEEAP